MSKKIKKKKKSFNKPVFLVIVLIFTVIISISLIVVFEKNIKNKMFIFCEIQMKKISKNIVLEATNNYIRDSSNIDDVLIIEKNKNDQIESITLDVKKTNKIISSINMNIISIIKKIDNNDVSDINLNESIMDGNNIITKKSGVVFEVPIGLVTNSSFLSNIGPKIPIKIIFSEELESEIKTEIESYGINNVLFKAYIEIRITGQALMPVSSKSIVITNKIPIITKMIQGDIPKYYFDKN